MDDEVTPPPEVLSYYAGFPEEFRLGFGPFRLARKLSLDPRFVKIRDRDLADGQHRNDTDNTDYFTTAYFHRPDDLRFELEVAAFQDVRVLGIEGPAWMLPDFDARWENPALRKDLLDVARALESEPSVIAVSAHLLGIGRKP